MNPAAFIDANVPIYAAGREHFYKEPCARIIRMVAENPQSFVTDAETLQELTHRYLASGRWELGRGVVRAFSEVMSGRIESVHAEDVVLAAKLADMNPGVSSRDLVHAAVMRRLGTDRIISADADFDRLEGIVRLDPARLEEWRSSVLVGGVPRLPPVIPAKAGIHRTDGSRLPPVIPAKAGIHRADGSRLPPVIPAKAGIHRTGGSRLPPVIPAKAGIHRTDGSRLPN